jgi:hypothetical protein
VINWRFLRHSGRCWNLTFTVTRHAESEFNPVGVGFRCFVTTGYAPDWRPSLHPWLLKLIPSGDPAAITKDVEGSL